MRLASSPPYPIVAPLLPAMAIAYALDLFDKPVRVWVAA